MKFKVGDKVKIRRDLSSDNNYMLSVTDTMAKYRGEIMTIKKIDITYPKSYLLEEDRCNFNWTEDMFEQNIKPTKEELFKMPLGTIIKTDREKHNIYIKVGENDFCNDNCDHIEDHCIEDDLTLLNKYDGTKIVEIQEPTYITIYKADEAIKEMTIAEIEKELGYPIKVIKED